jgi:hypothetical protein
MEKVTKDIESAVHGASFNEMSVYGIFSKEEEFKSERLTKIVDNSFFDDLICVSEGMKMEKLPLGENVKLVFMNPDGRFFCQEENGNVVLVCALNLSWIPIYIYNGILKHFKKNHQKPTLEFDPNSKTLSKIPLPLKQRLKAIRKSLKKKIRSN